MGHSNGVISAPVNTDDVGAVIGSSSHDVATLCRDNKVKKFNKNKPYRGTSPAVYSRTVDNYTNQTGKFLGCRGQQTGYPVYWGMQYPMNTAQQNNSGNPRNNLLELCYDTSFNPNSKHPNYEYMKPELGTDFCRLDDFVGYNQSAEAFLDAGVEGATPGGSNASIKINKYDNSKLTIFAAIPSDSYGFMFDDIIPEADSYYLVAEFYRTDMVVNNSSASPSKTVKSAVSLGQATGMIISFEVSISEILSGLGLSSGVDSQFYVCVGFNKYSGSSPQGSSAFIAPWKGLAKRQLTLVSVMTGTPWRITVQGYAFGAGTSITESSYQSPSSSETTATNDTLSFKTSFYNGGSSNMTIYFGNAGSGANKLMFRATAYGNYRDYRNYNAGYIARGGNDYHGPAVNMRPGLNPDVSSDANNVTIYAGDTKPLYFRADNLLPYGYTNYISIEVSNDGGASWDQAGHMDCNFKRIN